MKKYYVEVGGFVTVWRHRCLEINAENEAEAKEKAVDKFIKIQSEKNDCDSADVLSIC